MRFLYITLGACLLFTNLSLKASDLAKLSSEKQGIYQQLKEDFPHLLQRISMYDEALKARDQGLLHVASHLKIEDALRLRLSGLVDAWSQVQDQQRVISRGLSSFYDGLHKSQQLHRKIWDILNSQVGGEAAATAAAAAAASVVVGGGASAAAAAAAAASVVFVGDGAASIRHREPSGPVAHIEQKGSDDHDFAGGYPFPENRFVSKFDPVQALQNLINHWYDGVALPNEEEKSTLGRLFSNTLRRANTMVNGTGPDEILRRKLYILAGNAGSKNYLSPDEVAGRDLFLSFLLYKSAEEKINTNRDWLPSFDHAVELFARDRFSMGNNNFEAHKAVRSLLQDRNMPAKWSTLRGTKGLKFWHVQLFADQYQVENQNIDNLRIFARNEIMSRDRARVERAYGLIDETLLERVPVHLIGRPVHLIGRYKDLVKARDQKALQNILAYSKERDATYKKEGCGSCFGTKWKVARRNLRYLVEQFNKNHDKVRPLQDLLNTYQKNGIQAALESLQWGFCKNSFSLGSDVNGNEIIIVDAIWHENLLNREVSL